MEGAEFGIGSPTDGNKTAKKQAQLAYAQQLEMDIASMAKDPSKGGLDISFTFGGKSRDDRPTTQDRRQKVAAQEAYRRELDMQMQQRSAKQAYDRVAREHGWIT